MGSTHSLEPSDATLPPLGALKGRICPRCYRPLEAGPGPPSGAGVLPRCPVHGLAYVDSRDLIEAQGDAMLGETVAGRFTILSRLGSGSMGAVYRARQEAVGRDVALKIVHRERVYDPETKTRFEREARATSSLVSPNTVTVFDFGLADDGSLFLAMELLDGETLGQRLRRVRRLGVSDAVRIAREALRSLAEAHAKGIVHRDLKPDNLFLAREPHADGTRPVEVCKVVDFGIAKVLREESKLDQLETQAGTVFGTPRYMSPEQAQGVPLDARSDLYSLGVILYQMLAGRPPFVDDDAVVVMARHIKDEPPTFMQIAPEASVPPAIERVVRRALAKSPELRQESAELFSAELEAALEQSGALASGLHASWVGPSSAGRAASASARRTRALVIVLGAAVALALTAVGVMLFKLEKSASRVAVPSASALAARPTILAPQASASDAGAESAAMTPSGGSPQAAPRHLAPHRGRRVAPVTGVTRRPGERYGRFQ
jgi:eukaryotic-like serine/threonine-protein kinase